MAIYPSKLQFEYDIPSSTRPSSSSSGHLRPCSINDILIWIFDDFILEFQMDDSIPQSIYSIKTYGDRPFRLVTQNKNGPCPILAIYNLLALRGTIKIPATSGLSAENMMQAIGEVVLTGSSNQSELIEGKVIHYSNKCPFPLGTVA